MFDPTVFDNLKVIVEGYVYDLDLEDMIKVLNRSDIVDLATMTRKFKITFGNEKKKSPSAILEIYMDQDQISGELSQTIEKPGCYIKVLLLEEKRSKTYDELLLRKLKKLWDEHSIKLLVTEEVTANSEIYYHCYEVNFQRSYGEDDIEDLLQIIDHLRSLLQVMIAH
ncbi:hypothetical protein WQ54_29765 [Bacillus sp. SA1-12]|uniref:hypothetical protein n=1 Tax=Bacillus sp. SA1-12 TaxID=1455638 RepID=UPI0006270297|nr:hypothetical protein [Bacillus sp. SA1-12]KKI88703.1 hypothetical protein WQ54_29765 [Bacillus sp. SA1-12]